MADDKKQQNVRARQGQAATRVVFDAPVAATAYNRGAQVGRVVRDGMAQGMETAGNALANAPVVGNLASVARLLSQQPVRVAAQDFIDGIAGNPKGGKKVPVQPEQPVEQAMAIGRQAAGEPNPIMPADRQSQMIAAILGSGLTVNEAASVAGILPQPPTGRNAPDAKDTIMTEAAKVSRDMFEKNMSEAQKLLAAGKTDEAKELTEKASTQYFNQQAGLTGFNPLQIAQAQLMDGAQ